MGESVEAMAHLGSVVLAFVISAAIVYSFALLGRAIRSVWPSIGWSRSTDVLWNTYIGAGIGAFATSVLGMVGFFNRVSFIAVLTAGPLLLATNKEALGEPWYAMCRAGRWLWNQRLLAFPLLAAAAIVVSPTAAPEIFYDALNYHLGLQQQYLISGEIQYVPAFVHSAFPAHLDVLFGLCMGLGGPAVAKFFNLMLFGLACCATAVFVEEVVGDERAGLVGAVVVGTVPGALVMTTMSGIDAALIGFSAMSALALARMRSANIEQLNGLAILAAVGAGTAAGSKYTGLWLIGAFVLAILASVPLRSAVRLVPLFVGVSLLLASPWYVRNGMMTGDPVYPILSAFMGDEDARWAVERIKRDVPAAGLSATALKELVLGLLQDAGRFGAGAQLGLLVPIGAGVLLAGLLRAPSLRPWALVSVVYVIVWMSQSNVIRYIYPIFPFCALGVAWGARALRERLKAPVWIAGGTALLALLPMWQSATTLDAVYGASDLAALFTGRLSKDDYLGRRLAYYPAAQWLNSHSPQNSRVYFLGETRLLYLDRAVSMSSAYNRNEIADLLAPDAPPLFVQLKNRGVTHILIHGSEVERLRRSYDYLPISTGAEQQLRAALSECRLVFAKYGVQVCELPR